MFYIGKMEGGEGFKCLHSVIHGLLDNHFPKDDTQVEKLTTWIKQNYSTKEKCEHFLNNTKLIHGVKNKLIDSDTCAVSSEQYCFGLGLMSYFMAACKLTNLHTDLTSLTHKLLLKAMNSDILWSDASVRNTWMQALSTVISVDCSVVSWMIGTCVRTRILSCTEDDSLFVCKEAACLLAHYLTSLLLHSKRNCDVASCCLEKTSVTEEATNITTHIIKALDGKDKKRLAACLSILNHLLSLEDDTKLIKFFFRDNQIDKCLISLLHKADGCSLQSIVDILSSEKCNTVQADMEKLVWQHMYEQQIEIALSMAQILTRKKLADMGTLVKMPICAALGRSHKDLTGYQMQWLSTRLRQDKRLFVKVVIQAISTLQDQSICSDNLELLACLLNISVGKKPPSDSSPLPYIISNTKIQHKTLSTFTCLIKSCILDDQSFAILLSVLDVCVTLITALDTTYMVFIESLKCILGIIGVILPDSKMLDILFNSSETLAKVKVCGQDKGNMPLMNALSLALCKRLCDLSWEVRDSSLEFLTNIIKISHDAPQLVQWFVSGGFTSQIWQCVYDAERYVKATALTSLSHMVSSNVIWQPFIQTVSQETILEEVLSVAHKDTEVFPRRAAIEFVIAWSKSPFCDSMELDIVLGVMTDAIHDFDWQVKLQVLDFWKNNNQKLFSEQEQVSNVDSLEDIKEALQWFVNHRGSDVLIHALEDYDRSVQAEAAKMAVILRTNTQLLAEAYNTSNFCENGTICQTLVSFVTKLRNLDLDQLLRTASKSTDEYADNPDSLLSDMLLSIQQSQQNCEIGKPELTEEEEGSMFMIDCY